MSSPLPPSGSDESNYWNDRYRIQRTGWDVGYPSTPLRTYIDQLTDRDLRILIPGAGNGYEAEYLHARGFTHVDVLDIAPLPLEKLCTRVPAYPPERLVLGDFFEHTGTYDLILEQTFFCSFAPTAANRRAYARQAHALLVPGGKLVGVWFRHPLDLAGKRPYGGGRAEYLAYLEPFFRVRTFEPCYNSIKPRRGNELFGIFVRRAGGLLGHEQRYDQQQTEE